MGLCEKSTSRSTKGSKGAIARGVCGAKEVFKKSLKMFKEM